MEKSRKVQIVRSLILGIIALIIGVFGMKKLGKSNDKKPKPFSFDRQKIEVVEVKNKSLTLNYESTGRLKAYHQLEIFSEVSGMMKSNNFREGNYFSKGNLLLSIDDSELRENISSQRSQFKALLTRLMPDLSIDFNEDYEIWHNFLSNFSSNNALDKLPESQNLRLKQFLTGKNVFSTYFSIKSLENRLAKYKIYAPYNGILIQTNIEPGSMVRAGQLLGLFSSKNTFELEAPVNKKISDQIKTGSSVTLFGQDGKSYQGIVQRKNQSIDPQTQMINIYILVNSNSLKQGEYLSLKIAGNQVDNVYEIDRNQIVDGQYIYLVNKDSSLVKRKITILSTADNKAIISDIEEGSLIPRTYLSTALDGMKVIPEIIKAEQ